MTGRKSADLPETIDSGTGADRPRRPSRDDECRTMPRPSGQSLSGVYFSRENQDGGCSLWSEVLVDRAAEALGK